MIRLTAIEPGLELWVKYDNISQMARKRKPSTVILQPDSIPEHTLLIMENGIQTRVLENPVEINALNELFVANQAPQILWDENIDEYTDGKLLAEKA